MPDKKYGKPARPLFTQRLKPHCVYTAKLGIYLQCLYERVKSNALGRRQKWQLRIFLG
jgi:hypothetical protein